jgi:predicted GNAT family acetyltransferase
MEVIAFDDAAAFQVRAAPVIERAPADCSILATVVDQAANGAPVADGRYYLIGDGSAPVSAAIHTPPYHLLVTPVAEDVRPDWAKALAGHLRAAGRAPAGVTGPTREAEAFVAEWQSLTGLVGRVTMSEGLFEMREPPAATGVRGGARRATEDDIDLLARWFADFDAEAHVDEVVEDAGVRAGRRLRRGRLLFWVDGGSPVSLAGLSVPVFGVSRIGPVYTPPEFRRHGYASALTAEATRMGLAQGSGPVVLYTDLANPTSNKIYQAIGYRPVNEAVMYGFRAEA